MREFIVESLELASERSGDLTPQVYTQLFARLPEAEVLFLRDTDQSIRGSMLSWIFSMILDVSGSHSYGLRMIQNEVVTHEGYGVTPRQFVVFFEVLRDTVRTCLGEDWTAAFEAAWEALLADMNWCAFNPYSDASGLSQS